MSGRVQKSVSNESRRAQIKRNRQALGILVEHRGYDAMPCSPCFQHHRVCKMDLANSKRCSEYVARGLTGCNSGDMANALNRCFREQKKVKQEEQEAEEALEILQTQLAAALGRLSRLRKQKRFLKERGSDLIRRGMQSVDEWEEEERVVAAQEAAVLKDLNSWGAGDSGDWGSFGVSLVEADFLGPGVPGSSTAGVLPERVLGS
ncbi:uncharacterized protein CTRU02_215262 [Colletotrichum truncatum]|uniref:Uncharacterized protein n=1 Tax=Colletotrichum truncatum TaxID=5467 RepID=A0ACC3YDF9_COLTU